MTSVVLVVRCVYTWEFVSMDSIQHERSYTIPSHPAPNATLV